MKTGIIYIATNTENLKSYVGQTLQAFEARQMAHRCNHDNAHFHKALRKYGMDAFEWRILEEDIPEARLNAREELWIAFYDTFYNGYNSTSGGDAAKFSDESRQKMSDTHSNKVAQGIHHVQLESEETRQARTAAIREKMASGWNPTDSAETRAKISAAHKEKSARGEHHLQTESAEDRAKRRAAQRAGHARYKRNRQKEAGQQFLW